MVSVYSDKFDFIKDNCHLKIHVLKYPCNGWYHFRTIPDKVNYLNFQAFNIIPLGAGMDRDGRISLFMPFGNYPEGFFVL